MIKAYLDSYSKITVYVGKNYYDGKINSLYLLTEYGPVKLGDLNFVNSNEKYNEYSIVLQEDMELGKEYYLVSDYGYKVLLEYRYITKSEKFRKNTYTDEKLGYEYSKDSTSFSIWAPVSSDVILVVNDSYYKMKRYGNIFKYEVIGDLNKYEYYFIVKNNGKYSKVMDPYAYSYNFSQSACVVIDLNELVKTENLKNSKKSKTIYETSVRDFSSSKAFKYKGKFLGVVDEESIDYLDNLGIEYVQFMPINYFDGDVYNSSDFYNWGYNPYMYGVCHPNYVYNLENPYSVVNECKEMINKLHSRGIKVTIDMVFSHIENREDNLYNLVVPYYAYLMENNKISNGSYCGFDIDSSAPMVKRFFVDICKRWVNLYNVDGFRFDLMGIMNYETMNDIYNELRNIKENIFVYGEGWNMPCLMSDDDKAIINNASKMKNISFFNDYYRESLKYDYLGENVIRGNYESNSNIIFNYNQSINYLECHDNYTYYDLQKYVELRDEKLCIKRQTFKNLIILLSNGYAFFHSGQEFFRTKKGCENSYAKLDDINTFDWNKLYKYSKEVNLVEKMIKIREKHHLFDIEYKYKNDNNVIYLDSNNLSVVINMSNKNIKVEDKEVLLTTNKNNLEKYDLVIYKK